MKRSKRLLAAKSFIEKGKLYNANEAVELIKKLSSDEKSKVKFDETIDISFNLNLKKSHTIRDTIILPHTVKVVEKKILVFAKGDKATEAEDAGAQYVGGADYVDKIKGGWLDFDVALATPDMMKDVGKLGGILGRKGLMPNPKTGTITFNIKEAIGEIKKGKVVYRADKTGIINLSVGKRSMELTQILENAKAIYLEILRKRPSDLKGEYIKSVTFSSTMGPGVKVVHGTINTQ